MCGTKTIFGFFGKKEWPDMSANLVATSLEESLLYSRFLILSLHKKFQDIGFKSRGQSEKSRTRTKFFKAWLSAFSL